MIPREPVNILLVDDQPAKLLSYEAILTPLGERLIKAGSGKEALEHLLRNEVAVVLIDVNMPDLDGFELATLIRQHPRHQRAAIIFVSAIHLTDIDRLRGFECGGVDYVPVPVESEILRARVSVFADLFRKTKQLEMLNRELEQRVAERTSELNAAAGRLRASEAALRETDRRKDEFLAMLAHELRNPLAPIRNVVDLLRQQLNGGAGTGWSLEVIERQLAHLTRLVDDLLDVSRITRGNLELRPETADLADILNAALEGIRPELDAKGLELHLDTASTPVAIRADVVRLTQVVRNLLNNAVKFTRSGGSIWLAAARGPEGVRISVRDSGQGIRGEDMPRLFQMFYQSRNDMAPATGGLGIGLALVRQIVELHGGTVEASSPGADQGSEFVLRLPILEPRAEGKFEPRPRPQPQPAEQAARRILIVDDNQDYAESLALLFRRGGNEVMTAYDGLAAVDAAKAFHPDGILLDIGLPLLDGYHAARRIREEPWGKDITLVAVTGWGQEHDRRRSREAGFDAHLVKPVKHSEVAKLLAARAS